MLPLSEVYRCCGNIKDEVFEIFLAKGAADRCAADGRVHVCSNLGRGGADRRPVCLLKAILDYMGVSDWEKKLIVFGWDGASINMGASGLRGFLQVSKAALRASTEGCFEQNLLQNCR